jgi:hypothetical protein
MRRACEITDPEPYSFGEALGFIAGLRHIPPRDEFRTLFLATLITV